MAFRHDATRGNHPITPKKGIKETDLTIKEKGNNDTITVAISPSKKIVVKPNYQNVENALRKVFETKRIEYYGKSWQTGNHIFFMNVPKLTPEIITKWSETFPEASHFSVSKGRKQESLHITVDVTDDDFKTNGMG